MGVWVLVCLGGRCHRLRCDRHQRCLTDIVNDIAEAGKSSLSFVSSDNLTKQIENGALTGIVQTTDANAS
jgi:hypothetical protein